MNIEMMMGHPYWVIDILPKRVPKNSDGQYFKVEQYYLAEPHLTALREKFLEIILNLNCYYAVNISTDCGDSWLDTPNPDTLEKAIVNCVGANSIYISTNSPECLIMIDGCDTYMTVYATDDEMIETLKQLVGAVGLFMRQA